MTRQPASAQPHQRDLAGESWNPQQYLMFADHRLRPAQDLLARIPLSRPAAVYDLGCGSGNVTRLLAQRWPNAAITGVDNSPEMLAQAQAQSATAADADTGAPPSSVIQSATAADTGATASPVTQTAGGVAAASIRWQQGDLADWQPDAAPDLLYSNAVIQWVPDHRTLVPRLWDLLPAGGCLAVQAPLSWDMLSHRIMRQTLADGGPGGAPLGTPELRRAVGNRWVQDADFYYDLLAPQAAHLDVWTTEYQHILTGADPVLEWVTGTGLRPILNGLDDGDRARYRDEYRRRLNAAYPRREDGSTLYPFRRLFFVAIRQ